MTPRRASTAVILVASGLALARGEAARTRESATPPVSPDATAVASASGECILVFPLPVHAVLCGDFGDPRGAGRTHEGMDLAAPRMTPVHAVAPGEIAWLHDERGGRCCDIEIRHDDGWRSRYIHLNNDTPGTDDGQGWGIADGLRVGTRVEAGDVIGWVGDSGNAEAVGPHLHFELRDGDGRAVDPHAALAAVLPPKACPDES